MSFLRKTWLLWVTGLIICAGFVTLAGGRLSVGPLLLVLGYCILLPLFLWRSFQKGVGE